MFPGVPIPSNLPRFKPFAVLGSPKVFQGLSQPSAPVPLIPYPTLPACPPANPPTQHDSRHPNTHTHPHPSFALPVGCPSARPSPFSWPFRARSSRLFHYARKPDPELVCFSSLPFPFLLQQHYSTSFATFPLICHPSCTFRSLQAQRQQTKEKASCAARCTLHNYKTLPRRQRFPAVQYQSAQPVYGSSHHRSHPDPKASSVCTAANVTRDKNARGLSLLIDCLLCCIHSYLWVPR